MLAGLALILAGTTAFTTPAQAAQNEPQAGNLVVTSGAGQWVEGNARITPAQGTVGTTLSQNSWFYNLPGEFIQVAHPPTDPAGKIEGTPYDIAYASKTQPVMSSDWWTGVGLQWPGWVQGADPLNPVLRTPEMFNEPWNINFIDLPSDPQYNKVAPGLPIAPQGLRLWNRTTMRVLTYATFQTDTVTAGNALFGYGDNAQQDSPILTIGLSGTHPIADNTPAVSTQAPWTNVKVNTYSDWGVEMGYTSKGSAVNFTFANGSPFVWAQRTQGNAPFVMWAGTAVAGDDNGAVSVWRNSNGVLGVNITNSFNPVGIGAVTTANPAAYAIVADAGAWSETTSTDPNQRQKFFQNNDATRIVVIAMPHNVPLNDNTALNNALNELLPYAAQRITGTQLHYPPIPGSDTSVVISGTSKPLGYDRAASVIRLKHAVTTEAFIPSQPASPALQMLFPHHRKAMIAQDQANILLGSDSQPKYTWRSLKGELQAYAGNSYVRELTARGVLPFLPNVAMNSMTAVNGNVPAQDVYASMKAWFYQGEPATDSSNNPFVLQNQAYFVGATNTYVPGLATLFEGLNIADQLSKSPALTEVDVDLKQSKQAVAAGIRDFILDTLKEFVGRMADVSTSNVFQYNSDYNTFIGYPEGYQSAQNLDDKHFHYGYLLRSAAAIGRRDPAWLQAYLPFFNQVRSDVANYDRSSTRYPFLRNFSPFYGHNWADGVANGGNGNNQESTSEAINFAAGVIELGQVTNNPGWVDIGMYLYEEEILATEQYWFNQDGNPNASSGQFFNGNWPDAFVQYQSNQGPRKNYNISRIIQALTDRSTFFAGDVSSELAIQATPLSASGLYLGRNPQWLSEMWAEYINQRNGDGAAQNTPYENILAGIQAQVAGSNAGISDPGPFGALARVNTPHKIFYGAVNMQAKHWAYSLNALGQIDSSVIANTPNYAVFCKAASGAKCAGGARTFVVYNAGNSNTTVTFKDADTGATVQTVSATANALTTQAGNNAPAHETISPPSAANRLYLRKPASYSATCEPQTPVTLTLETSAGAWLPAIGSTAYPTDTSALADSVVCVPKRTRGNPPDNAIAPDLHFQRAWQGTFSGSLITQTDYTRFSIYSNQSLFPGWQRDPCVAAGQFVPANCPNGNWNPVIITPTAGPTVTVWPAANAISMQFWYDFESDGTPDRIEWYLNLPLDASNSWSYDNKLTDHATNAPWPNRGVPVIVGGLTGTFTKPFPASIPADKPATVTLYLYGGSSPEDLNGKISQFDVPVSVNASPLTNRASWIMPPYRPLFGAVRHRVFLPWLPIHRNSAVVR
jgi:hypothetical protein